MSSRALRKLHGDSDLNAATLTIDDSDEVDINEEICDASSCDSGTGTRQKKNKRSTKKQHVNPFDLLAVEDEEIDSPVNDENPDDEAKVMCNGSSDGTQRPASKSKQKKKNKKNKNKQPQDDASVEAHDEDEIDISVREVNEMLGALPTQQDVQLLDNEPLSITGMMKILLSVEHRNLNADNEMKRIFGSRVVQAEQRKERNNRNHRSPNTWLSRPKDDWPRVAKNGLSMKLLDTAASNTSEKHFTFEHSREYQKVQFLFLDAVESHDPRSIMDLVHTHPAHVDSLLQLSEICKMGEDMQTAASLLERALYVFECNFHTLFSLTQGNCRLDFRHLENRSFYLALFRHMLVVGQRGCYRTALELCKLIMSLDPEGDPLCMLLAVDFYALRSQQYGFLVRMADEWEAFRNLSQLPNFAFSIPLAMFHMANKEHQDLAEADEMLQKSLLGFPSFLSPLLDKCSVAADPQVAAHAFFGPAADLNQPIGLRHLVTLYVGRCHSCWKEKEVMSWLERNVRTVLQRVDDGEVNLAELDECRQTRYRGTPRNIYRHILISDIKEATTSLPVAMANSPVLSYDPLPPTDSISSYTRPERRRRINQQSNSLSMFFQSLLPNFDIEQPADSDEGAAGGSPSGGGLQQSVGAVVDAMRNLLQNIQMVPPPVGEQGELDEQRPEEEWD